MPARKPKVEDDETPEPERDRGPGPSDAVTLFSSLRSH